MPVQKKNPNNQSTESTYSAKSLYIVLKSVINNVLKKWLFMPEGNLQLHSEFKTTFNTIA